MDKEQLAIEKVTEAAKKLCDQLDTMSKDSGFQSVFFQAYNHGMEYTGPTWDDERKALLEALEHMKSEEEL